MSLEPECSQCLEDLWVHSGIFDRLLFKKASDHHLGLLFCLLFLCAKPLWQPLDPFRLSRREFGMHCRVIFRPSQLFLPLEELSKTIFSLVLILTVGHLVASRHLNVSRFVIRHHLLPSC